MTTRHTEAVRIPMTPDHSVCWERYEIPSFGAVVIKDPACTDETVDMLLRASQRPLESYSQDTPYFVRTGEGNYGVVCRPSENPALAIKIFKKPLDPRTERHQGLSGLRTNVSLATGIGRLAARGEHLFDMPTVGPEPTRYALTSPTFHAAILYPGATLEKPTLDAWAMSYEEGISRNKPPHQYGLPYVAQVTTLLDQACRTVGMNVVDINYDLGYNRENIIERPSKTATAVTELVKIDSYAHEFLTFSPHERIILC